MADSCNGNWGVARGFSRGGVESNSAEGRGTTGPLLHSTTPPLKGLSVYSAARSGDGRVLSEPPRRLTCLISSCHQVATGRRLIEVLTPVKTGLSARARTPLSLSNGLARGLGAQRRHRDHQLPNIDGRTSPQPFGSNLHQPAQQELTKPPTSLMNPLGVSAECARLA